MLHYFIRRLGYMLVTLVIVAILGFIIMELPPGSFVETEISRLQKVGGSMSQEQVKALYRRYGLDQPEYVRFWKWISGFVRGDFGEAFAYNLPVSELIGSRLVFTVVISLLTLIFSWGGGDYSRGIFGHPPLHHPRLHPNCPAVCWISCAKLSAGVDFNGGGTKIF